MGNHRREPRTYLMTFGKLVRLIFVSLSLSLLCGLSDAGAGGIGTSQWESYDAGAIGVRLRHPEGWDATIDEDAVVLDNARTAGREACVILVGLFERDSQLQPLALVEMMAEEMSMLDEPFSDVRVGEIQEDVPGFGYPASSLIVDYTRDGSQRTERIFAVLVGDRLYAVLALGPRVLVSDRMTDDMWGILRSIEFD